MIVVILFYLIDKSEYVAPSFVLFFFRDACGSSASTKMFGLPFAEAPQALKRLF